jgi:aspartyl-tRNA(Asn)/glutamyl-tRNA(Gln) amidotransferase subunit C
VLFSGVFSMAQLTLKDVEYVAALAQLSLDDAAKARMLGDLGNILGYVEKLNELDTTDVEPMMHVLNLANVYREDVVGPSLERSLALKNAPNTDGDWFLVPRILDAE